MIELIGVSKKYGDKVIFDEYSLKIEEGEFVALVGESGCGKSTLLNIIGLIEKYDKGYICIDGNDGINANSVTATKLRRSEISYLFQNFALVDEETVFYNLKLALRYTKGNKHEKIKTALEAVGLSGYENKKIYQLSGGEQQRVALARVMIKPSKIVLADEPTGSLDAENRDMVMHMLKELQKQGKTIVMVTHDMHVASMCDRIVKL